MGADDLDHLLVALRHPGGGRRVRVVGSAAPDHDPVDPGIEQALDHGPQVAGRDHDVVVGIDGASTGEPTVEKSGPYVPARPDRRHDLLAATEHGADPGHHLDGTGDML